MTYVISDIHGMYDKYEEILRKIDFKESDVLYVIGDVVDRGEAPMKVLLDMMSRPNVYPLMGNHDLIALELLPKVDKALVKSGELHRRFRCGSVTPEKPHFQISANSIPAREEKLLII